MQKKKFFFFYLLTFFFAFFFLEIASRLFVSVITKKFDILKYGYNKNIDLQIRKLSKLDFEIIDNTLLITKKINFNKKNLKNKKIWTYGGSTSDIACRKENITSWPNELNNEFFKVINFAKSGTNSDFALNSLISSIHNNRRPDIILWANYVNETDVITFGFKRNPDLATNVRSSVNVNKSIYFIKSLSKSLKNYSVFFFLLEEVSVRIMSRLNMTEIFFTVNRELSKNDLKVSAKNYYLNTTKAIELAKKIDTDFYIITLFNKDDLINDNLEKNLKFEIFSETIQKIIEENNEVNWINLKEFKIDKILNFEEFFCDSIHYTTKGNEFVADIISKNLL